MSKKKLGLDIGHYLASAKGVPTMPEWEFNLAVAKEAKTLAEFNNFEVVMAQPFSGETVKLAQRYPIYNNANVDLIISIHANAFKESSANGNSVFYWHSSTKGKRLAETWAENAKEILTTRHRGIVKSEPNSWTNFGILRYTNAPAILTEHGFMTNPEDLEKLKSDEFRKLCAILLVKTACEFEGMEFKLPTPPPKDRIAEEGKYFRVQLGAFTSENNAKKFAEEIENKYGLETFVTYY